MKSRIIAVAILGLLGLLLVWQFPQVRAQNLTLNLPSSLCSIQGSNYLLCSQIDGVKIEGKTYNISLMMAPNGVAGSQISFTNVADDVRWSEALTSVRLQEKPVAPNNYFEIDTGTFQAVNGSLAGTISFDVVGHRACGRACAEINIEINGTIALE